MNDTLLLVIPALILFEMARPKPLEEMTNVSIRAPLSLVEELKGNGTNLTDITVAHWRTLSTVKVDPRAATIQTKLIAAVNEKPSLKRDWQNDDVSCEAFIRAHYLLDEFDRAITSSEISTAMTKIIKEGI
jgi:hypothetical protein